MVAQYLDVFNATELKMVKVTIFMLCVFYHTKNNEKESRSAFKKFWVCVRIVWSAGQPY